MHRERRLAAILVTFSLAILCAGCQGHQAAADSCPVTEPNGEAPGGEAESPLYFAQQGLTTVLWPDGMIPFDSSGPGDMRDDGSLAMKFPFWRGEGIRGQLTISGHRLDGDSPPAYGEIPEGYGDTGFQASAIVFPTPGCWEVTARADGAGMRFVQRAVLLAE